MHLALLSVTRGRTTSRVEITMTATDNTIAATRYIEISCPRNRSNRRCRGRGLTAADFNGDGKPDIVAITKTQSLVQAMLNLSSPGPTVRGDRRRD